MRIGLHIVSLVGADALRRIHGSIANQFCIGSCDQGWACCMACLVIVSRVGSSNCCSPHPIMDRLIGMRFATFDRFRAHTLAGGLISVLFGSLKGFTSHRRAYRLAGIRLIAADRFAAKRRLVISSGSGSAHWISYQSSGCSSAHRDMARLIRYRIGSRVALQVIVLAAAA